MKPHKDEAENFMTPNDNIIQEADHRIGEVISTEYIFDSSLISGQYTEIKT